MSFLHPKPVRVLISVQLDKIPLLNCHHIIKLDGSSLRLPRHRFELANDLSDNQGCLFNNLSRDGMPDGLIRLFDMTARELPCVGESILIGWLALARGGLGFLTWGFGIWRRRLPTAWRGRGLGDENGGVFCPLRWMVRGTFGSGRTTDGMTICDATGSMIGMVFSSRTPCADSIVSHPVQSYFDYLQREKKIVVILDYPVHIDTNIWQYAHDENYHSEAPRDTLHAILPCGIMFASRKRGSHPRYAPRYQSGNHLFQHD